MEASYSHFYCLKSSDRFSRIHFLPLRSKGRKSILEKWSRESGKEKGPGQLKRMLRIYLPYYKIISTRLLRSLRGLYRNDCFRLDHLDNQVGLHYVRNQVGLRYVNKGNRCS